MVKAYNFVIASFADLGALRKEKSSPTLWVRAGVIASILSNDDWMHQMTGAPDVDPADAEIGAVVSLSQDEAFLGALLVFQFGAFVVVVAGSVLQAVAINLAMMYAGRVVCGFAIGLLAQTVPVSWWVSGLLSRTGSGTAARLLPGRPRGASRWPLQAAPASPRGRDADAISMLQRLHGEVPNDPFGKNEFDEIKAEVVWEDHHVKTCVSSLWSTSVRRTLLGCGVQLSTQLTGVNVIKYYFPKILETFGYDVQTSLLINSLYGIVGPATLCNRPVFSVHDDLSALVWSHFVDLSIRAVSNLDPQSWQCGGDRDELVVQLGYVRVRAHCVGESFYWRKILLLFFANNAINATLVYAFFPETKGRSLDAMSEFFGDQPEDVAAAAAEDPFACIEAHGDGGWTLNGSL
ncbi:hypothetical protein DFJ77DRAFT_437704 [Powellomyces hirtus]|nr:hypothetical protein DFJ77DRAFT_437704 [Powellomyces hirtus]